ncbi:MAG: glycosyltransferase, partial [Verrucomicrobiae bacterium]|nr:glycosyltransferase [Verrucomicrobiae bacterium]
VPPSRFHYIANGLDVARFAQSPDPGLRQRRAPGRHRLGVMMARITEQKAPELLAEAVGLLRQRDRLPADAEFWIVGERDSPATEARLLEAIQRHRLEEVVRLFPATDQPAAPLHAADFTILFSLWEGTPNAVLESLAAGRPAIVSAAANASEVIQEGVQGWVVPTSNVAALADRLDAVLSLGDTALRAMAPSCRARAAEFDLSAMVARYEALYQSLGAPPFGVPPSGGCARESKSP